MMTDGLGQLFITASPSATVTQEHRMKGYRKITKTEFYNTGGLSNPRNVRTKKWYSTHWEYWTLA